MKRLSKWFLRMADRYPLLMSIVVLHFPWILK